MYHCRRNMPALPDSPLCELFEEGFAQHCEHVVMEAETWHCSSQDGWLDWCRDNEAYLASRYLADTSDREKRRRFFGSWYDIDGWRQTGYYLGCRAVAELAQKRAMAEIAAIDTKDIGSAMCEFLNSLSNN